MAKRLLFLFSVMTVLLLQRAGAQFVQKDTLVPAKKQKIAVFAPLYLDSVFDASGSYRFGSGFPKFALQGLEYYEGVQMAVDSLNKTGVLLDVHIFDTRAHVPLATLLQSNEMKDVQLMMGVVGSGDVKILADAAQKRNIPFVSSTYPNDGGITGNPSFIMLNSSLKTHCEGIYKFIQRQYATSKVVMFRKKGTQEDRIKSYFSDIEKNTPSVPLKIRYVDLPDSFSVNMLRPWLDTISATTCIAGSFDDDFGKKIAAALASLSKKYRSVVFGMPNWDVLSRQFTKSEYKGLVAFYSTPYYNGKTDRLSTFIQRSFKDKFKANPSDMVFKGYESMLHFAQLLVEYKSDLGSNISSKKYKVFTDFDIQPVLSRKDNTITHEYFENRKLYFIKRESGEVTGVY
jgi:Periplasmic binding protein